MADLSDVEAALTGLVSSALYPDGATQPSAVSALCRIYRGWPNPSSLNSDLAAGVVNVTIFPDAGSGRVMTRYPATWQGATTQPTVTASVSGTSVTISGSAEADQLVGLLVDGTSYVYRTQNGDTPPLVAANLAALVSANHIAIATDATVAIPGAYAVIGRTARDAMSTQEVRRQERNVQVICWCPSPDLRDAVSTTIDSFLARQNFISLDDGTEGRLTYSNTSVYDQSQNALLYRRDLVYTVEYATIVSVSQPTMLFGDLALNAASFIS
ncbi:MAG TPA: hypothetical protein VN702_00600 [Acetobacteraceae bacterium]|nr:hypothetical protein [Acetobacteraceae bacterium]